MADSKPVKQEVNGIVIPPPLVFPVLHDIILLWQDNLRRFKKETYHFVRRDDIIHFFANFEDFWWHLQKTFFSSSLPKSQNQLRDEELFGSRRWCCSFGPVWNSGLSYKSSTIVIYDRNDSTIVRPVL